jgi:hypothetical protein
MNLMVQHNFQDSFMAPRGVISDDHSLQIQDCSQLFHDGLGAYGVVRSPLLQFEVLRFSHEVLQWIPESFKTKFSLGSASTVFFLLNVPHKVSAFWDDVNKKYDLTFHSGLDAFSPSPPLLTN